MKELITPRDFQRITNDTNGNPRYVLHFLKLCPDEIRVKDGYRFAVKLANLLGGRKYSTKSYGCGIVFQCYSLEHLCKELNEELTKQGVIYSEFNYLDSLASVAGDKDMQP